MLQTIITWLQGYPGLENLTPERLEAIPGSAGLFCQGEEILSRRADILGGAAVRRRLRLLLRRHCTGSGEPQALLDLARWAASTAPILGQDQTLAVENGRLIKADAEGVARYEVRITFEFTVKEVF